MSLDQKKYEHKHETILRDVRPLSVRIAAGLMNSSYSSGIFTIAAASVYVNDWALAFADLIVFVLFFYFLWLSTRDRTLAFKMPRGSRYLDGNAGRKGQKGKADGILYAGNVEKTNEEVWFTNSDARTHILYLGTTGAGKTEGLKSLVTNAMAWGSGFVYVDGKADTDLWSSLSSLVRRFGRDDDLLVLNYMTGNSDVQAPSNTMNPFSSGSASYLTNMLVSLMPDGGGDNAMWKERAVSLVGSMMPVLTWKRDHQEIPMSVRTIREYLSLNNVIKLARDEAVPREIRAGVNGYLDTLPGFIGAAYDDNGQVKPPGPDTPQYNTETASQQHGYLAMQFTRSLQSLGDDYGYIFDTQAADVDMVDVVLNRRILVVLVPALEKSGDEVANLGKIVASSIKGMMGSTLGSNVEGDSASVIENKPTHSSTPFMTVFDEVGYYVAEGMAVMAAQARSLGFCLVFSGQDLPALKKRVREEANSITANCNIKIFGKLEDPTETKDFFEKTVGSAMVTEVSGYQMSGGSEFGSYSDTRQAGVQLRPRASYDGLRGFKEGQAVITFGDTVVDCSMFYSNPGFAKAMRVTRFVSLPPPDENMIKHANSITKLRDLMVNKTWTATRADVAIETPIEIVALGEGFKIGKKSKNVNPVDAGIMALVQVHAIDNDVPQSTVEASGSAETSSGGGAAPQRVAPVVTTPPVQPQSQAPSASPLSTFAAPAPAQSETPLVAVRPADITASAPPSVAKPAIFGAPKAPAEEQGSIAQTSVAPQTQTTAAKPAIFGAPKAPAEDQGSAAQVATPAASTTQASVAPQTQTTAAKPAIFGAPKPVTSAETPATPPEAAAPVADTATASPVATPVAQAPVAAKPAIFGAKPAAQVLAEETPPARPVTDTAPNTPVNKPAIFGVKPPAAPPAEPASGAEEDALRKAAEEAKKHLFGDNGDDKKDE
jgi:intracellular multiplication protein IcmO